MKKLYTFISMIFITATVTAQQLPQFTQFYKNKFLYNPAVAGSEEFWRGNLTNRFQWTGIKDAPRTHLINSYGKIRNDNMGVGAYLLSDQIGPTQWLSFMGSYAYHVNLSDDLKLGMGLHFGVLSFQVDGSEIILDQSDDIALSNTAQSVTTPDATFGLYLYDGHSFWVSLSAANIINQRLKFFDGYSNPTSRLVRHYYLGGGYNFDLTDNIDVEPSVLLKYVDPVPLQMELALRVKYADFVYGGFGYRMDDAVSVIIGAKLNQNIEFGYSYDFITSDIATSTSGGSHELTLGIIFGERSQVQ